MPELRFCLDDPLLYADMREALHLGAEILHDAKDGLLLKRGGKLFAAGRVSEIPAFLNCGMAIVRDTSLAEAMMAQGRFTECMEVVQLAYTKRSAPPAPRAVHIRPLTPEDTDFVLKYYVHPSGTRAYIEDRIRDLMLGAFEDGKPIGFIGVHIEGAMGMLEVLPACRGRGVGKALQAALMARLLERGGIPYCHVQPHNAVSLRLQTSLGLQAARQPLYWLYKPV